MQSIFSQFEALEDPRIERSKRHRLLDIIGITLCGIGCGADNFVEIEACGKAKYEWLRHILALPNGIPSHWTLSDLHGFPTLRTTADWPGLHTLVMLQRERRINDHISHETAYFIASATNSADHFLTCTRAHWSIENSLHWILDISFQEDACRVRKDFAPQNLAVIRHFALNLLNADKSTKASIQTKRLKAGWDDTCLLKLLSV